MTGRHLFSGIALGAALAASSASAAELRFTCYQDGVECDAWAEQLKTFESENPGVTIAIDVVPYQAILESLPLQLAGGEGPDVARVTDLGGLAQYMLDITPHVAEPSSAANPISIARRPTARS